MQALCAHGVKTIYYCEPYDKSEAPAIASLYGVELIQVTDYPLSRHFPLSWTTDPRKINPDARGTSNRPWTGERRQWPGPNQARFP